MNAKSLPLICHKNIIHLESIPILGTENMVAILQINLSIQTLVLELVILLATNSKVG